jgi:hypothetical protein
MRSSDAPDPFLRVPSRREKLSTLLIHGFFSLCSLFVMFWALDADLKQFATWMCGYSSLFFGMNTWHGWRSFKNGWNIREDNQDFYGPLFSWTTSKWLFLALGLGWYAAKTWL